MGRKCQPDYGKTLSPSSFFHGSCFFYEADVISQKKFTFQMHHSYLLHKPDAQQNWMGSWVAEAESGFYF